MITSYSNIVKKKKKRSHYGARLLQKKHEVRASDRPTVLWKLFGENIFFIFPAAARKLSQRTHFPNPSQKKSQRILYYKKQKLNTL